MPTEEKLSKFIEAANNEISQHITHIEEEMDEYKRESIERFQNEADNEAYYFIQKSTQELKHKIEAELSVEKREQRKVLFVKRNEIIKEISSLAKSRLEEYVKSDEYGKFLTSSIKKISEKLNNSISIMYCRKDDIEYVNQVIKASNIAALVQEDASIKLGGVRALNTIQTISIDDTLDTRLKARFEQFASQPDLIITA